MSFRNIAVLVIVVLLPARASCARASTQELSPGDRAVLADYARDTWRSIAALADRGALPADSLRQTDGGWVAEGLTSPTNIAAYLWSTLAAEDLRLIAPEEASQRIGKMLATLARLERSHGFYYNWYDPDSGQPARAWPSGGEIRPFLSVVDNGWMAAALILVGNARPEFRQATDALLRPMNFGFFYDPFDGANPAEHPGLLRGGYWPDTETFSGFHYGALNTEPRIASYIGIARGELPEEHYYRMFRSSPLPAPEARAGESTYAGVAVNEQTLGYRALRLVPSWDGTMFEALMVSLLVPEAEWAPRSWGANHPLYVRAQIEYGLHDARLGYWGLSPACAPRGGYGIFGVSALSLRRHGERPDPPHSGVIAPYASFLALPFTPLEALANLRALSRDFKVYSPYGFLDSVDVRTGDVSDRVLVLDQGMILAALSNVIGSGALRQSFCAGPIEAKIKPLISQERFESRIDTASPFYKDPNPNGVDDASGSLVAHPASAAVRGHRSSLRRTHLVGGMGILTVAGGAYMVYASRARGLKAQSPTALSRF